MDSGKCIASNFLLTFLNVAIWTSNERIHGHWKQLRGYCWIQNFAMPHSTLYRTDTWIIKRFLFTIQFSFILRFLSSLSTVLFGAAAVYCSNFQLNPMNERKRPSPGQPSCKLFTNYRLYTYKNYSVIHSNAYNPHTHTQLNGFYSTILAKQVWISYLTNNVYDYSFSLTTTAK